MLAMSAEAKVIWCEPVVVNQYTAFRREFELPEAVTGEVAVCADSDCVVLVNGAEIGRGQYSDFPDRKSWTVFRVPNLEKGKNVIAVLAYHSGMMFSTKMPTAAGFACTLRAGTTVIVTDTAWRATPHTGFQSGPIASRSGQLGETSCFDARQFPGDWFRPEFDASGWPQAVLTPEAWVPRLPRPVPVCRLGALRSGRIVKQGTLFRAKEQETFAATMQLDRYHYTGRIVPPKAPDNGMFVIADLGEESVGYIEFELEAAAGTVVDYAHGEHLEDGVVRMRIHTRNFADRYICHDGVNRFLMPFHRVGARYLQLNITQITGMVKIRFIGLRPWDFPLPLPAPFECDDLAAEPLRRVARRTLELCMHEHFEDCPWREQSMYSYDSRNQALYGYYLWGNYEFVRASFRLLAYSHALRQDHLMMLCAPTDFEMTIPVFSYVWVSAAYENYLYSGDKSLFDDCAGMVADVVSHVLTRHCPKNGLYHTGTDPKQWNFYEWVPDMYDMGCRADEFHAGYNLYVIEMLEAYAALLGPEAGREYLDRAGALRRAVDAYFWNEAKNAYASKKTDGRFHNIHHDHTQFLALRNGVATGKRAEKVMQTLFDGTLHYATTSALPYLVRALMPRSAAARSYVSRQIRKVYGAMLEKGATSLWETPTGAADFDGAASLCHGWSSLPIYYQSGCLLGVTPLEPGFRRFEVRPYADEFTHYAAGTVPTPAGPVAVQWQRRENGLHLTIDHPASLECVVADYPECPVVTAIINGKPSI